MQMIKNFINVFEENLLQNGIYQSTLLLV